MLPLIKQSKQITFHPQCVQSEPHKRIILPISPAFSVVPASVERKQRRIDEQWLRGCRVVVWAEEVAVAGHQFQFQRVFTRMQITAKDQAYR